MILLLLSVFLAIYVVVPMMKKTQTSKTPLQQGEWQKPILAYTVPSGTHTIRVYTYDGRPLENVPPNTPFELEVAPGICNMQSIYTGKSWTGIGGVKYKGKLVGFMTDAGPRGEILTNLARRHGSVFVSANIRGRDRAGGWPLISIRVPSTTELRKLR